MRKSGFTLIELLAVIVILAIIALIATPIVLNIINNTKNSAIIRGAEYYMDAVDYSIVNRQMNNQKIEDGTYNILSNGNICLVYEDSMCIDELVVSVAGSKPISGKIIIENRKISAVYKLTIDNKKVSTNSKNELEIKEYQIYKITYENITETTNLIKEIEEGETLAIDLAGKNISATKLKVKINGELIDKANYTYENNILRIPNVNGNITIIGGEKYSVSYENIDDKTGLPTNVIEGNSLEINLTGKNVDEFKVYVGGNEVTNYEYNNNTITLTNVQGDVVVRKLITYKVEYENIDDKTGLQETVIEGNTLEINLANKGLSDSEIIVKINGTEIDGYTYTNYELIVPEVTGDVLVIGKNKPVPVSFLTDDWSTIIDAVKNGNTDVYEVGATKTITLTSNDDDSGNTDGITSGTYTVRLANKSTPSTCKIITNSETACGFVIEFVDIIAIHVMNETDTNAGGWPGSELYEFVTENIYNAIPNEIRSSIIDTRVVSGYESDKTENYTTYDKLYLLTPREVAGAYVNVDSAATKTRQLDYYYDNGVTTSITSAALKQYNNEDIAWWLRTASSNSATSFFEVSKNGQANYVSKATDTNGVSPAFRLG